MANPKTKGSKVVPGKSVYGDRTQFPEGYESGAPSGSGGANFFGGSVKNETGNNPTDKGHSKPSL